MSYPNLQSPEEKLADAKERLNIPTVVVICGSMRFEADMQAAALAASVAGKIVVMPHVNTKLWHSDAVAKVKPALDDLHRAKIRLANEVLVVGDYVGESTIAEVAYARSLGKPVTFTHPEVDPGEPDGDPAADEPAAVQPPVDRAALRDRIAAALVEWTYRGKTPEHGGILETVRANAYARADAVLAVLPEPIDQAATLSETERRMLDYALDLADDEVARADTDFSDDEEDALAELRRIATKPNQSADRAAALREAADALPDADLPFVSPMGRRQTAEWLRRRAEEISPTTIGDAQNMLRRMADEAQPGEEAEFTDASTAFMQIGTTPALQGLRAELRIEGRPPLVGRYAGAGMRKAEHHEGLLLIEPMLVFQHPATEVEEAHANGEHGLCGPMCEAQQDGARP